MALPLCVPHSVSSSGLEREEKKRAMEGAPFPSHTRFPIFTIHTHKKISTKSLIHLQMCSSPSMFPVEERERERREGRGKDVKIQRAGCSVFQCETGLR